MRSSFRRSLPPSLPFPCRVGYLFMRISPKHERQAEGDTEEAAVREKKGGKEESVSRLLFPLDRIGGTWRARMRPFTPRTHAMKHRFQREFFFSPTILRQGFHAYGARGEGRGSPRIRSAILVTVVHNFSALVVRMVPKLCVFPRFFDNCASLHFRTLRDKGLQVFFFFVIIFFW